MIQRIGFGFDTHALQDGVPLHIGGIDITHSKGAVGHSDADALVHAVCDALLGAAALGDIGTHFPDTDPQYRNIDSTILLQQVNRLIRQKGYHIANLDTTVCMQQPKLAPYILQMRQRLSEVLEIPVGMISIKAKTSERLGFIGREEGLSAYAVVMLTSE